MIINPNVYIYEHAEYVILYNVNTSLSYKIGVKEYEILIYFTENSSYDELIGKNEKFQKLLDNFRKYNILVEENYIEKKHKKTTNIFNFTKDKIHVNTQNKLLEVPLYLCVPFLVISIFFVCFYSEQYLQCLKFIKGNQIYSLILLSITPFFQHSYMKCGICLLPIMKMRTFHK